MTLKHLSCLDENNNTCDIHNCIYKVSDLIINIGCDINTIQTSRLIIKFNNNTKYNKKPVNFGFMKYFIILDEHLLNYYEQFQNNILPFDEIKKNIKDIDSEIFIYKNVIKYIVNKNICPHFINYLGSNSNCSYDNLSKILDKNKFRGNSNIINIINNMIGINIQNNFINKQLIDLAEKISFSFLINKIDIFPTDNIITYCDFMSEIYDLKYSTLNIDDCIADTCINFIYPQDNTKYQIKKQFLEIYFQIVLACYTLSYCGIYHNNLHSGNIWLELNQNNDVFTYEIEIYKVKYKISIQPKYKVMLYNFEKSKLFYPYENATEILSLTKYIINRYYIFFEEYIYNTNILNYNNYIKYKNIGSDIMLNTDRFIDENDFKHYINISDIMINSIKSIKEYSINDTKNKNIYTITSENINKHIFNK